MQTITYSTALVVFVNTLISTYFALYLSSVISMRLARRFQVWRNREDKYFVFLTSLIMATFHGGAVLFVMWVLQ